ncbi:hypothetical protein FRC09_004255 [Ceratobasidium sp. 395]|nr:hypothetical protein FRC09_004255 [Ceratobasidium sp. 395]
MSSRTSLVSIHSTGARPQEGTSQPAELESPHPAYRSIKSKVSMTEGSGGEEMCYKPPPRKPAGRPPAPSISSKAIERRHDFSHLPPSPLTSSIQHFMKHVATAPAPDTPLLPSHYSSPSVAHSLSRGTQEGWAALEDSSTAEALRKLDGLSGSRDSASLLTSTSLSSRKLCRNSGGSNASSGYAVAEAGGLVGEDGVVAEILPVPPLLKDLSAYRTPLMSAGVTFPGSVPNTEMGGEGVFDSASEMAGSGDPNKTVVFPSMSMTITSPTSPLPPIPTRQPSKSFSNAPNLRLPSGSSRDSSHAQKKLPSVPPKDFSGPQTPQKDLHGYGASPQKTPHSQDWIPCNTGHIDTSLPVWWRELRKLEHGQTFKGSRFYTVEHAYGRQHGLCQNPQGCSSLPQGTRRTLAHAHARRAACLER